VTSSAAPPRTLLYQNFPNPFPRAGVLNTTVVFDLAVAGRVSLSVYDLRGRLIRRLIPDAREGCTGGPIRLDAGSYGQTPDPLCVTTQWDGHSDSGDRMPAGIYLIRLTTERESHTVRTLFRP
jgi:hypothetical protein